MRLINFTEGEYYHVFNRGVEKRNVFETDVDRFRFVAALYYLNDASGRPARIGRLFNQNRSGQDFDQNGQSLALTKDNLGKLTDIICWVLMPNHFHLLLRETMDGGVSAFMHRLETSYALYFNTKNKRSGSLFGGSFKAVHVDKDEQLTHVSRYIHLNPLELHDAFWKERDGVENVDAAADFLRNYKWSSLPDYLGTQTSFAPIVVKSHIMDYFENSHDYYWKFLIDWTESNWSELSSDQFD